MEPCSIKTLTFKLYEMRERSESNNHQHKNQIHTCTLHNTNISKFNETNKSCRAHNDFLHIFFESLLKMNPLFRHCMYACHCLRFHGCWLLFSNVQTKDETSPQMDFIRYTIPFHEIHEAMMHSIYSFVLFFIFFFIFWLVYYVLMFVATTSIAILNFDRSFILSSSFVRLKFCFL